VGPAPPSDTIGEKNEGESGKWVVFLKTSGEQLRREESVGENEASESDSLAIATIKRNLIERTTWERSKDWGEALRRSSAGGLMRGFRIIWGGESQYKTKQSRKWFHRRKERRGANLGARHNRLLWSRRRTKVSAQYAIWGKRTFEPWQKVWKISAKREN